MAAARPFVERHRRNNKTSNRTRRATDLLQVLTVLVVIHGPPEFTTRASAFALHPCPPRGRTHPRQHVAHACVDHVGSLSPLAPWRLPLILMLCPGKYICCNIWPRSLLIEKGGQNPPTRGWVPGWVLCARRGWVHPFANCLTKRTLFYFPALGHRSLRENNWETLLPCTLPRASS